MSDVPRRRAFVLPYPPSINHYWRRVGRRTLLSREGRLYRQRVCACLAPAHLAPYRGPVEVRIVAHPPDRRRRDIDNLIKATLDSIGHARIYEDDYQVERLVIQRGDVQPPGHLEVEIRTR